MVKKSLKQAKTFCFGLFLVVFAFFSMPILNAMAQNVQNKTEELIVAPKGVSVEAMLLKTVTFTKNSMGAPVSAILTGDFVYNNKLIAKKGSILNGTVVSVSRKIPQRQTKIVFTGLTTPQGFVIPINAFYKAENNVKTIEVKTLLKTTFTQPVTLKAPDEYKYDY